MNRRSLLQALGLAAVAPVLPNIPVAAKADYRSVEARVLAAEMGEPLYAVAATMGPNGERYLYHMPAVAHYQEHKGRLWADDLVVEFRASFTGTVRSVEITRRGETLVTLAPETFDTPNWIEGMDVRITVATIPSSEAA